MMMVMTFRDGGDVDENFADDTAMTTPTATE